MAPFRCCCLDGGGVGRGRRSLFHLLTLATLCFVAFAVGYLGGGLGGVAPGGVIAPGGQRQGRSPQPRPVVDDGQGVKGPYRGLKERKLPVTVSSPQPNKSKATDKEEEEEESAVAAALSVDVGKTGQAVIRRQQFRKKMSPNSVAVGPGGVLHRSIFGFPNLLSRTDNLLDFARAHLAQRLQQELSSPNVAQQQQLNRVLVKKTPPAPLTGEAAPVMPLAEVEGKDPVRVGEDVPPERARQVLIATSWRSGSSFFGDLLQHYPGSYYSFEPLHFNMSSLHDPKEQVSAQLRLLSELFRCRFDVSDRSPTSFVSYLQHAARSSHQFLFRHNFRVWNVCQNLLPSKAACFLPNLVNQTCPLFPLRIAKTVRLRVSDAERLLEDPRTPNLRVVVLVRDPRAVMASRARLDWCAGPSCADAATACRHLAQDVRAARAAARRHPGRVALLRYEDLSLDPYGVVDDLLRFLALPPSPAVDRYILAHTGAKRKAPPAEGGRFTGPRRTSFISPAQLTQLRANANKAKANPYGLYRNSKGHAFAWRSKVSPSEAAHVEELCHEPMAELGYAPLPEKGDEGQDFSLITKTRAEVWPQWDELP